MARCENSSALKYFVHTNKQFYIGALCSSRWLWCHLTANRPLQGCVASPALQTPVWVSCGSELQPHQNTATTRDEGGDALCGDVAWDGREATEVGDAGLCVVSLSRPRK